MNLARISIRLNIKVHPNIKQISTSAQKVNILSGPGGQKTK